MFCFACSGHCPVCNHYTVNMHNWRWGGTPCILNLSTRWTHHMEFILTDTKKVMRSWMLLPKHLYLFLRKGLCEELKIVVESISTYRWSQERWLKVHGIIWNTRWRIGKRTNVIREAKKYYFSKQIENSKNKMKTVWGITRLLTGIRAKN